MELGASKDNTLYQSVTGSNSNGFGMGLFVGLTNRQEIRRALVQFDIAGAVPAGATIESVELTMSVTKTATQSQPVAVHRATADWGEGSSDAGANEGSGAPAEAGDATWTHAISPGQVWQKPGGDFLSTTSGQMNVIGNGAYTWQSTSQLVADVQGWVNDPGSNFGWILIGDEVETKSAKRLGSRENPNDANRPRLVIRFAPPG